MRPHSTLPKLLHFPAPPQLSKPVTAHRQRQPHKVPPRDLEESSKLFTFLQHTYTVNSPSLHPPPYKEVLMESSIKHSSCHNVRLTGQRAWTHLFQTIAPSHISGFYLLISTLYRSQVTECQLPVWEPTCFPGLHIDVFLSTSHESSAWRCGREDKGKGKSAHNCKSPLISKKMLLKSPNCGTFLWHLSTIVTIYYNVNKPKSHSQENTACFWRLWTWDQHPLSLLPGTCLVLHLELLESHTLYQLFRIKTPKQL